MVAEDSPTTSTDFIAALVFDGSIYPPQYVPGMLGKVPIYRLLASLEYTANSLKSEREYPEGIVSEVAVVANPLYNRTTFFSSVTSLLNSVKF